MEELRDKLETAANFVNDLARKLKPATQLTITLQPEIRDFTWVTKLLYWHPRAVISSGIDGKALPRW